ncbi:amino acid ABC transporter substrate-binding protein, PAAT family [Rhizobiales bacterium GAS113]|nr:amino acid ABC transporter substrate-binding protein, PAAT family [Rhizobiales bacterium GAS113]
MIRNALYVLAIAASAAFAICTVPAKAESTLDRILKDKKIRITAEVTSPPFGILDQSGQPDGSEIAVARQLAKDLGVELELVQVTAPQRIPALLSGRADVAISSLSITVDRAKTVAFANPHGVLSVVITASEKTAIKAPADLAGKRIAITRATLEEATVPKIAPNDAKLVFFDDIAATIQALLSGQVDAAAFSAFAAKSIADRNPDMKLENKFTVATAYYAAAIRQGDQELLRFLNTWVFLRTQDGTLASIYEKYTGVKLGALPVF